MFITKKKHNQIIEQEHKAQLEVVAKLEQELKQARSLEKVLEKLTGISVNNNSLLTSIGYVNIDSGGYQLILPDNVLQYAEDILGGKVIKQEGTKCLVVDKNGNVKTGLTKQKVDRGYGYKLVRE